VDGGEGYELLFVQNGDDILVAGAGNDTLTAGAGNDAFMFNIGDGADVITDFAGGPGVVDVIRLIGFVGLFESFTDIIAAATETGPDVFIDFGFGQSITLQNTAIAALSNDDFIFG
jgi:Ca2+-binding RTX toxin-like protein